MSEQVLSLTRRKKWDKTRKSARRHEATCWVWDDDLSYGTAWFMTNRRRCHPGRGSLLAGRREVDGVSWYATGRRTDVTIVGISPRSSRLPDGSSDRDRPRARSSVAFSAATAASGR